MFPWTIMRYSFSEKESPFSVITEIDPVGKARREVVKYEEGTRDLFSKMLTQGI